MIVFLCALIYLTLFILECSVGRSFANLLPLAGWDCMSIVQVFSLILTELEKFSKVNNVQELATMLQVAGDNQHLSKYDYNKLFKKILQ